jgi:hypothetical protein
LLFAHLRIKVDERVGVGAGERGLWDQQEHVAGAAAGAEVRIQQYGHVAAGIEVEGGRDSAERQRVRVVTGQVRLIGEVDANFVEREQRRGRLLIDVEEELSVQRSIDEDGGHVARLQ